MTLHINEKKLLLALKKNPRQREEELAKATGLDAASVSHAAAWLSAKALVRISETIVRRPLIGEEGKRYIAEGIPERKALKLLGAKPLGVAEAQQKLGKDVANIAIMWLSKQGLITVKNGNIVVTEMAKRYISQEMPQERVLKLVAEGIAVPKELQEEMLKLLRRGNMLQMIEERTRTIELTQQGEAEIGKGIALDEEISQLTPELIATGKWNSAKLREYDTSMPVKHTYAGRRHIVAQAVEYASKIWLEMGFKEMQGPLITESFWNFDALFTAQDNPIRELHDTFFIKPEDGTLPEAKLVARVKQAHEKGVCGSRGWGGKWDPETAKARVLRTHTTCLSAQTLARLSKDDLPAKYFSVGRCFRNETTDWKHGFEFNQTDGIVVDDNANFRHLIGYLKQFYKKLGFEKARFRPAYFPYTEMSIGIEIFHPIHKKWVELGGAGIFREEVTEPLLGKAMPVLAWGPGFDRLITNYYGINSFSELYRNDLKQLRETKQWLM